MIYRPNVFFLPDLRCKSIPYLSCTTHWTLPRLILFTNKNLQILSTPSRVIFGLSCSHSTSLTRLGRPPQPPFGYPRHSDHFCPHPLTLLQLCLPLRAPLTLLYYSCQGRYMTTGWWLSFEVLDLRKEIQSSPSNSLYYWLVDWLIEIIMDLWFTRAIVPITKWLAPVNEFPFKELELTHSNAHYPPRDCNPSILNLIGHRLSLTLKYFWRCYQLHPNL